MDILELLELVSWRPRLDARPHADEQDDGGHGGSELARQSILIEWQGGRNLRTMTYGKPAPVFRFCWSRICAHALAAVVQMVNDGKDGFAASGWAVMNGR